jgi:hypothetical protein
MVPIVSPPGPTQQELANALEAAAQDLWRRDGALDQTTERVVVARFMIYLERHLVRLDNPAGFCLDMEYERAGADPKTFAGRGPDGRPFRRKIVPDLVYHRRLDYGRHANHLAVEIKTRRTKLEGHDLAKLSVLTGREPYAFASFTPKILIRREPNDPIDPPCDRHVVCLPTGFAPYKYGALLRLYKRDDFIQWV